MSLAIAITLILGFILALAGWCSWAWVIGLTEIRTTRRRARDSLALVDPGHSSVPGTPDPGLPLD